MKISDEMIEAGAKAVKSIFEMSLIPPDNGFSPEDIAKAAITAMLPLILKAMQAPCEHQWENVMVSDDEETYICGKCMKFDVRANTPFVPEKASGNEPHDEIG